MRSTIFTIAFLVFYSGTIHAQANVTFYHYMCMEELSLLTLDFDYLVFNEHVDQEQSKDLVGEKYMIYPLDDIENEQCETNGRIWEFGKNEKGQIFLNRDTNFEVVKFWPPDSEKVNLYGSPKVKSIRIYFDLVTICATKYDTGINCKTYNASTSEYALKHNHTDILEPFDLEALFK
ncbi:hypothetical protein [Microbulbifer hainanensis]|uniref:hypothetical protein n=1 Tax=Microbulbifer hainanensis TaxID=2735675 RepID=UPI0018684812|nr:hypothetical protein [Microbulbifer hainanensis]